MAAAYLNALQPVNVNAPKGRRSRVQVLFGMADTTGSPG
jgi:hypothetical protein